MTTTEPATARPVAEPVIVPNCYCGLALGVEGFLVVVLLGVVDAGFCLLGSTIFTWVIFTGLNGRSLRGSVAARAICFTSSLLSHWPKIVCRPSRCGVGTSVMKNCDPFVFGPELAIAKRPG